MGMRNKCIGRQSQGGRQVHNAAAGVRSRYDARSTCCRTGRPCDRTRRG